MFCGVYIVVVCLIDINCVVCEVCGGLIIFCLDVICFDLLILDWWVLFDLCCFDLFLGVFVFEMCWIIKVLFGGVVFDKIYCLVFNFFRVK